MDRIFGLFGVAVLIGIACLISSDRRRIPWRIVGIGIGLQALIAWLFISFPPVVRPFDHVAAFVSRMISFAGKGSEFVFGSLSTASDRPWGFVFAFQVLPIIVFFAAFMSVMYHIGVMQRIVTAFAWVLHRTLGVTATEALSAAANIFVGQTEAPLCIRPYLSAMTRSQIMAVMTGGFATIAGSVLAAYVARLGGDDEASRILFAKHLMTASVMSAPAGFVMAKIMVPEMQKPSDHALGTIALPRESRNIVDAAASGATDGLKLALNVGAMLIAFVGLLALLNWPLTAISQTNAVATWLAARELPPISFESIIGTALRPVAFLMGIPWSEAGTFGGLLGKQVVLTEFVAYMDLASLKDAGTLSPRSAQIATYALCGFANLPSIAIQIGGLSALAPDRRADFASLGPRAMVAGALACWMTATIAGLFIA